MQLQRKEASDYSAAHVIFSLIGYKLILSQFSQFCFDFDVSVTDRNRYSVYQNLAADEQAGDNYVPDDQYVKPFMIAVFPTHNKGHSVGYKPGPKRLGCYLA
jgi:hypothetical protein